MTEDRLPSIQILDGKLVPGGEGPLDPEEVKKLPPFDIRVVEYLKNPEEFRDQNQRNCAVMICVFSFVRRHKLECPYIEKEFKNFFPNRSMHPRPTQLDLDKWGVALSLSRLMVIAKLYEWPKLIASKVITFPGFPLDYKTVMEWLVYYQTCKQNELRNLIHFYQQNKDVKGFNQNILLTNIEFVGELEEKTKELSKSMSRQQIFSQPLFTFLFPDLNPEDHEKVSKILTNIFGRVKKIKDYQDKIVSISKLL